MRSSTARWSVLGVVLLVIGCANETDLRIIIDLQSVDVFRHAASFEVSLHDATDMVAASRCLSLRDALLTNPPTFEEEPLRTPQTFDPCDVLNENVALPDLPRDAVAYLVAVRDVESRTIATGCVVRGLDDYAVEDTGGRVLPVTTLTTRFYEETLAGTDPAFLGPEARCEAAGMP